MGEDQAGRSLVQFLSTISRDEALTYVEELIALFDLDHASYFLPRDLQSALLQMRPEIVSILGELKNKAGDTGRHALQVLAGVQEWRNIDVDDQAAIRMVIQDRFGHQHQTMETILDHPDWMAVRTEDQDALIEALGFGDSMPVTKHFGEAHIVRNVQSDTIYLSAGLDGWLLVFGYDFLPDTAPDSLGPFLCELSRKFGSAHWYHMDFYNCPRTAWAIAERGELIRYYNNGTGENPDDRQQIGPPHPAELAVASGPHLLNRLTLPCPDPVNVYVYCNAYEVAAHASVERPDSRLRSGVALYTHISGHARIAVRTGITLPLGAFVY